MKALGARVREQTASPLPREWLRGPALLQRDHVVLADGQRERYVPSVGETGMLFELAGVEDRRAVERFVGRYGLLACGPEADEHRERLEDWRIAVGWIRWTLSLASDLAAVSDGDAGAYEAIRRNPIVRVHADEDPSMRRLGLGQLATRALARAVSAGIGDARLHVADVDAEGGGEPGLFTYLPEPPDLLGHAFAALAQLIVERTPLATCPECGRFFAVKHGRQRFCTPSCANRARYKRFVAKQKATTR